MHDTAAAHSVVAKPHANGTTRRCSCGPPSKVSKSNRRSGVQLAQVTAPASEAIAVQESSSDQRLAIAAHETQQQVQRIQQWTEQRSSDLQKERGADRAEGATLEQQLSHASAEIDHLKSVVASFRDVPHVVHVSI